MFKTKPKSFTKISKIYFWTASIHQWHPLLADDQLKNVIINYLKLLSDEKKITSYAFVIMPTHLHFIWQQHGLNGRETPKGSFMKFTAHRFRHYLLDNRKLHLYKVNAANKAHEIWQRDALGIEIYSRKVAQQKIAYIHANPVKGKWRLAKDDMGYKYSSAVFYETGKNDFGFLKNIYELFD